MNAEDNAQKGTRIYLILIVIANAALIIFLASKLYRSSAEGFGYIVGGWVASFILSSVLCLLIRNPNYKHLRGLAALTLTFVAMFGTNYEKLRTTNDAQAAVRTLATVAGPDDLKAKLDANSNNPILAFAKFALDASTASNTEIQGLFSRLSPPSLSAPVFYDRVTASELNDIFQATVIAKGNAAAAITQTDFILQRERARVADWLKQSRLDQEFRDSALRAVAKRNVDYFDYYRRLLELKGEEMELTSQLMAIFIKEYGRYTRNMSGIYTFSNGAAVKPFNDTLKLLDQNAEAQDAQLKIGDAIDARYQQGFERLTKTEF